MARNEFKFGQSDLFDRGQFNDLLGATFQSQVGGLRGERNALRRDRAREKANLDALGSRFQNRVQGLADRFETQRGATEQGFQQRQGQLGDAAQQNLGFLNQIFGGGLENQGDPNIEGQLQAAAEQSGLEEARRLEQQGLEEDLAGRQASGQQAINQARASAFNRFLERQRQIGTQIDQLKKSRPLIAQQIREQLENRGIALEELGMAKGAQAEQKRQFDESLGLKKRELDIGVNDLILKNKQSRAQLKAGYGEIITGVLSGTTSDVKMPVTDPATGEVKTITQTITGGVPKTRAEAISKMQNAGVPRAVAKQAVNRWWESSRRGEAAAKKSEVLKLVGDFLKKF